jgi:serine phosphatase RsbU (regulator of sigma subunit)
MVNQPLLAAVAAACAVAGFLWGRSSLRLERACKRIEGEWRASGEGREAAELARQALRKGLHTTLLYGLLALGIGVSSLSRDTVYNSALVLLIIPVAVSIGYGRSFFSEARLAEQLALSARRANEILKQEQSAPLAWAGRLAPSDLPHIEGFEVGQVYEPGTGAMAGDFYDLFSTGQSRLAAVIGDVAGHGIEPSITAFQVKYLLRVFLRQYRDPAQAIEELNIVMSAHGRPEEMVSLCAVIFDMAAGTLRFASAGHPAAWLWHDGEVRPLRSTGPLLTLDPNGTYFSREIPLQPGDLLLMYTDGLAEARSGEQLFGEDRIGGMLRRDPGEEVTHLCKSLLESARDFSPEPLSDDIAILAIRRT